MIRINHRGHGVSKICTRKVLAQTSRGSGRPPWAWKDDFDAPGRAVRGTLVVAPCRGTAVPQRAVARRHGERIGRVRASPASNDDTDRSLSSYQYDDLNHLHTLLKKAVDAEDFEAAACVRDRIQEVLAQQTMHDGSQTGAGRLDWSQMGILDWLLERAVDLGFGIPTPVQSRVGTVIAERADCILAAPTGSGKTLAFLLPLLSLLEYPPDISLEDVDGPQLVVVVPTKELGAQIAMIVYKLFGGSVAHGIPGNAENMFRFSGPRGLKVKGLILEDEVEQAVENRSIKGAHVVIGTPPLIVAALHRGVEVVQHCRALCVDEADSCYKLYSEDMDVLFSRAISRDVIHRTPDDSLGDVAEKPVVVLSGATLSEQLIEHAIQQQWIIRDSTIEIRIGDQSNSPMSSRIRHRYVIVEHDVDILGALCRLILQDQKSHDRDAQPTRGIVYVKDAATARKISEPLRNIFWGKHSISVLLPDGSEPIKNLHAFRDNKTSLLIATSSSSRGLDLPSVTHVYSTFVPSEEDGDEYVHMAGRLGRIGADLPGIMTTIVVKGEQVEHFMQMLVTRLGVDKDMIEETSPPIPRSVQDLMIDSGECIDEEILDDAKRALETVIALSNGNDNPSIGEHMP